MKITRILILFILSIYSLNAYSNKDIYKVENNGITMIGSIGKPINFKGTFCYSLALYSDGQSNQFAIRLYNGPILYVIPALSKCLLKLEDDSVIELTAMITNPISGSTRFEAIYPISEEQLTQIFKGIKKIRYEYIMMDKKKETLTREFQDMEFKKDKMGKELKKWYEEINGIFNVGFNKIMDGDIKILDNTDVKEGF